MVSVIFFKNLGKISVQVGKNLAKIVLKSPGRAFEIGANVGSAFASLNPKAALSSLPEVNNFLSHRRKAIPGHICKVFVL